jgi:hypothetical protein
MSQKNSLCGCINNKWIESGNPDVVPFDQVLEWAKQCSEDLTRRGVCRAHRFKELLKNGDQKKLRTFLSGYHFSFKFSSARGDKQNTQRLQRHIDFTDFRACLSCGMLNFKDVAYCSYCQQPMPY